MKPEETVDYHIKSSWLSISRMYNQLASKHDMTQAVGYILLLIDEKEGINVTQIGPLMGMEPTGMTRILNSMEKDGLIVRQKDKSDGRKVRICLTDIGKEKKKIARTVVRNFNNKLLKEISEEEFEVFKEVISKVHSVVDQYKTIQ